MLVRWLEPHPDSWERDSSSRPVCPGPLHINNCLWQYAKTEQAREVLTGFVSEKEYFGFNDVEQTLGIESELHAYYGLLSIDSIESRVYMCPLFERNSSSTDRQLWLQTVTMV